MGQAQAETLIGILPPELWYRVLNCIHWEQRLSALASLRSASKTTRLLANCLTTRIYVRQLVAEEMPARPYELVTQLPALEKVIFDIKKEQTGDGLVWHPVWYMELISKGLSRCQHLKELSWSILDGAGADELYVDMGYLAYTFAFCPQLTALHLPCGLADSHTGTSIEEASERNAMLQADLVALLPIALRNLKDLALAPDLESTAALEGLSLLTQLTCLSLLPAASVFVAGTAALAAGISALTQLQWLELQFAGYGPVDLHSLLHAAAASSSSLKFLAISHQNDFSAPSDPATLLAPLAGMTGLEQLHIKDDAGYNVLQLSSSNLKVLHSLSNLHRLTLDLGCEAARLPLPSAGSNLAPPAQLRSACLGDWGWHRNMAPGADAASQQLQRLIPLLSGLSYLQLSDIPAMPTAQQHVRAMTLLSSLTALTQLVVAGYNRDILEGPVSPFFDPVLKMWSVGLTGLKVLELRTLPTRQLVSNKGLVCVASGFPSLQELYLTGFCNVTPTVLALLASRKPSMTHIHCQGCPQVKPEQAEESAALLQPFGYPVCNITAAPPQ